MKQVFFKDKLGFQEALKAPYFTLFQIFIFHLGLQCSGLTGFIFQRILYISRKLHIQPRAIMLHFRFQQKKKKESSTTTWPGVLSLISRRNTVSYQCRHKSLQRWECVLSTQRSKQKKEKRTSSKRLTTLFMNCIQKLIWRDPTGKDTYYIKVQSGMKWKNYWKILQLKNGI